MAKYFAVAALLAALVAPAASLPAGLGIHYDGDVDAPLLKLDYATYRGKYDNVSDVFIFKNIRFAAPPVGNLRWAKPASPRPIAEIQDGSDGRQCVQAGQARAAGPPAGEDCLFLDVTVPGRVLREKGLKLPVVNWVYGGAYIVGSKEGANAAAMIRASKGNLIWVAGNYRLGAYGFLTGTTVEKTATPNAGFWDQRAVLQWIQQYIGLLSGDPGAVTTIGISAGAGSILHHLVLEGGTLDPLFTRAILQSPGYNNWLDRAGQLEANYQRFESLAGCTGQGLACLRNLSEPALLNASIAANAGQRPGSFAFGPAPDGKFIVSSPTLEIAAGRYWKGLSGLISSHVVDEGGSFSDPAIATDAAFDALLNSTYPGTGLAGLRAGVQRLYPAVGADAARAAALGYKDARGRLGREISEMSFTCHNRVAADGYPGKTWSVQYSVPPGTHGADQTGTFFDVLGPRGQGLSEGEKRERVGFQGLLVSFMRGGDPNAYRDGEVSVEWPRTTGFNATTLGNVLEVHSLEGKKGMRIIEDGWVIKERCAFWTDAQRDVMATLKTG
ncbi:alpha/beta-hydrolase [Trichodelitschia bisporula]|uniref:Alpha/beta-hydrolase n=1 Tax=Trichodelitschia bisporula TaxID=703511 RepID=A0A6G1HL71_9PEZI|nr:alpha/beta-hydrolase [Trichodelitschia bisporula]